MALPTPTAATAIVGYIPAGKRRYVYVTTIATLGSPSSAELTAGTDVTSWVIPDGVSGFSTSSETVDDPNMSTRKVAKVPGMTAFEDSSIRFRQAVTGASDARGLFHRDDAGYMCIFPEGIITGAKMSVFQTTVTTASSENADGGAIAAFMVGFAIADSAENIAIPTA
jgi:hypothetical protein